MLAANPAKCVILLRVNMERGERICVKRLMNLSLCFRRTILVLACDMQHQWSCQVLCLGETLLDTDTVITDCAIRFVSHRQQVSEVAAQAKTDRTDFAIARGMLAQKFHRSRGIVNCPGLVQTLIKRKGLL